MTYTFKSLAKEVCKREGKLKVLNIADVSEVLRILVDINDEELDAVNAFLERETIRRETGRLKALHRKLKPQPKKKRRVRK